jgi:zinc protease
LLKRAAYYLRLKNIFWANGAAVRMRGMKWFTLVFIILLATQLSCVRRSSSRAEPSPSPSPGEQAAIDQILQRYEQALGGRQAIDSVKTYHMKGVFQVAGVNGTIEGWHKDPEKSLTVVNFTGKGTLKKGFDGQTRWVQTPTGTVSDPSPQELAELERDSEVYSAGNIRGLFDSLKLENKARLNGRDMYVIEGKPTRGPAEKLFFDVENGLLVRWDMARKQAGRGTLFVKVHLNDYRDVDGLKVPFNVRFAFESFNFEVQVQELEHNITIDDAMFKKPGQ